MPEKLLTPTQLFTLKEPTDDLNTCLPGIYKIKNSSTIKKYSNRWLWNSY